MPSFTYSLSFASGTQPRTLYSFESGLGVGIAASFLFVFTVFIFRERYIQTRASLLADSSATMGDMEVERSTSGFQRMATDRLGCWWVEQVRGPRRPPFKEQKT
jgi:hypothetical protein